MAMNKAEKARVAELEEALSLCWPPYPTPATMTREEIEAAKVEIPMRDTSVYGRLRSAARGWFYNAHTGEVTLGWSAGTGHNRNSEFGDNGSQNMGQIYKRRSDAAKAMRIEMSREFARKLAAVDRIIAEDD